jgi:hypothetical protein
VRLTGEKMLYDKVQNMQSQTVTALSTANDARNGQTLHYLLASNQMQAAQRGAKWMGVIGNGIHQLERRRCPGRAWGQEHFDHTWTTLSAKTTWSRWLSSEISAGYDNLADPADECFQLFQLAVAQGDHEPAPAAGPSPRPGKAPAQNQKYAGAYTKAFRATLLMSGSLGKLARLGNDSGCRFQPHA